jgi:predicted ATP-binding protein involved in virulence
MREEALEGLDNLTQDEAIKLINNCKSLETEPYLPVSLLCYCVRAMLSITADLAWRCVKLNPHFGINAQQKHPELF